MIKIGAWFIVIKCLNSVAKLPLDLLRLPCNSPSATPELLFDDTAIKTYFRSGIMWPQIVVKCRHDFKIFIYWGFPKIKLSMWNMAFQIVRSNQFKLHRIKLPRNNTGRWIIRQLERHTNRKLRRINPLFYFLNIFSCIANWHCQKVSSINNLNGQIRLALKHTI